MLDGDEIPPPPAVLTARALLDAALLALRAVDDPEAPLREIESHVASALREVYRALGAGADLDVLRPALAASIDRTRDALGALQSVPAAIESLAGLSSLVARALGQLSAARYDPDVRLHLPLAPDPRLIVPATVGVPTLLALPRDALLPAVPLVELPPPDPPPVTEVPDPPPLTSMEALRAFVASQPALDDETGAPVPDEDEESPTLRLRMLQPARDPEEQRIDDERATLGEARAHGDVVFDRAQQCFEDLALLGAMRRPLPEEGWRGRARAEERLLARVDAIAACGDAVLPRLVKLHEERPLPDPDLTWATIFLFGSLSGDDAIDQVARTLAWTDLSAPAMVDRVADALSHAPHPAAPGLVSSWLQHDDPLRRAVAVTTLARRRLLDAITCAAHLGDPDLMVVRAAARALIYAVGELPREAYERALASDDEEVVRAGFEVSLRREYAPGYERAAALTRAGHGAFADAVLFVASAAPFDEREVFAQALGGERSPALYDAIGRFGDAEFVDALLRALDAKEPAHKAAAAFALQRITGGGLTKSDADPRYADGDRPFVRTWREPEAVYDLNDDAKAWRAWWKKYGSAATLETRWRWGRPWSPRDELWEMTQPEALWRDRRLAACALTARTGVTLAFDTEAFVPTQSAQLDAWRAALDARGVHRGASAWPSRIGGAP